MFSRQPSDVLKARKPEDVCESASAFCRRMIEGMAAKADEKKRESLLFLEATVIVTVVAPIFITLGSGLWWGKVTPSALCAIAAICTAWLQIRRPQHLWGIYRNATRELENEETKYRYRIDEYEISVDPDKMLAKRVADIVLEVHRQWMPLVPKAEEVVKIAEASTRSIQQGSPRETT